MNLSQPHPARLVQRGCLHLLQQLLDHAADTHDLRGLLDQVGEISGVAFVTCMARWCGLHGHAVGPDDDDARWLFALRWAVGRLGHDSILAQLPLPGSDRRAVDSVTWQACGS